MKKIILFLITTTTFTNVSYASFPVVEKVSNQTTGSNVPLYLMGYPTLIIWTIVVFTLYGFLFAIIKLLYICKPFSGYSVARLSRLLWEQEVAGSNPATPTFFSFIFSVSLSHEKHKTEY